MLLTLAYEPGRTRADPGSGATDAAPADATALGFLLHKHPGRVQRFSVPFGSMHVLYPEATAERCEVAMLLDVDAVALAKNKRFRGDAFALGHYVNDRPYVASSLLAVALGAVFSTAMTGRSDSHPELAAARLPLRVQLPAVPTRRDDGGLARRLFEGCGWTVEEERIPLDPAHSEWGDSPYATLTLTGTARLSDALKQLYVLLPVLDDTKHYWVGDDEVDKLARAGEGWLPQHPERGLITRRYLLEQRSLIERAQEPERTTTSGRTSADQGNSDPRPPRPLRELRADAVLSALADVGATSVVDMGCGSGALLRRLMDEPRFARILGSDVSARALEQAARSLGLERAPETKRERISRLRGFDAMVLMEVIEHVDPSRLDALEDSVFGHARPKSVVMTTPNAEFNAVYPDLEPGTFRHTDHRFEWNRAEFADWAAAVAERRGYTVEHRGVGETHPVHGAASQLAVFRRRSA